MDTKKPAFKKSGFKKDGYKKDGFKKDRGDFKKSGPGTRPGKYSKAPRPDGAAASVWGIHAVTEAWKNPARTVRALYITQPNLDQFYDVIAAAQTLPRPQPRVLEKKEIDRLCPGGAVHQGIALDCDPLEEVFVQDLIISEAIQEKSVLLMLDQVTDPHNVGAILRSACAFGAGGVIMQRRHAPELTGVLVKTASGAAEHIKVAYEINLSQTIETLQDAGYVVYGLDERGESALGDLNVPDKCVLVLGAEGAGLRPKVAQTCNALVCLPTAGPIASLNVSNAAAVGLYALLSAHPG